MFNEMFPPFFWQKVQELKEKVLRQKEDLEAARNKVNKTEKDKTSRRHDDTFERSKDPSRYTIPDLNMMFVSIPYSGLKHRS